MRLLSISAGATSRGRVWELAYPSHSAAHGVGEQLNDVDVDADGGVPQGEEQVHGGDEGGGDQTDNPGADGVGRHVFVVVADGGAHLKVGRVLLEQGLLEVGLLLDIVALGDPVGGILVVCVSALWTVRGRARKAPTIVS